MEDYLRCYVTFFRTDIVVPLPVEEMSNLALDEGKEEGEEEEGAARQNVSSSVQANYFGYVAEAVSRSSRNIIVQRQNKYKDDVVL